MSIILRLEQEDLQSLAKQVAENLKPQLAKMNDLGEKEDLMTVDEVAKYLKCSPHFIYKLTAAKEIPHRKRGVKFLLFRKSEIDKWLDSHMIPAVNTLFDAEESQTGHMILNHIIYINSIDISYG